jgi:hypothetical protein
MNNLQFGIMETLSTGPLLGFAYYPYDDEAKFSELNVYLILFGLHFRFYSYE